jgi:molybdopterin converting factor small subunit
MAGGRDMNVRWDAVVDRTSFDANKTSLPLSRRGENRRAGRLHVEVLLFGALAAVSSEQSIKFDVPAVAMVADVLAELRSRLGEEFFARLVDENGVKQRYCRLFVDGQPVEDLRTPLNAAADPARVEMILLMSPEGG